VEESRHVRQLSMMEEQSVQTTSESVYSQEGQEGMKAEQASQEPYPFGYLPSSQQVV
jgi:hypothetical protein